MTRPPVSTFALRCIKVCLSCAAGVGALVLMALTWTSYRDARTHQDLLQRMQAGESWPVVEGTILGRGIDEESADRFFFTSGTLYHARLSYNYVVQGVRYTGARICLAPVNCGMGTRREDAQALLERYPLQGAVEVRYNPDAPAEGVLGIGDGASVRETIRDRLITAGLSIIGTLLLATMAVRLGVRQRDDIDED